MTTVRDTFQHPDSAEPMVGTVQFAAPDLRAVNGTTLSAVPTTVPLVSGAFDIDLAPGPYRVRTRFKGDRSRSYAIDVPEADEADDPVRLMDLIASYSPGGGSGNLDVVIVTTGAEARPPGPLVVLWVDTRGVGSSRPINMGATDLWFTPNSGAGAGSDTTAPSIPTGLASSAITTAGFTLNWSPSTDDVGTTGYEVRLNSGTPVSVSGVTKVFTGLTAATNYSAQVRAHDAASNFSDWSSALSVTTSSSGDTTAPTVPTGLASSAITSTGFTVSWTASTDSVGVTGYEIRANGGTATAVGATPTNYTFTGLSASTNYSVDARARDAAGNWSAWSSTLSVTTSSGSSAPSPFSRWNFGEGTGDTATAVSGGYTMTAASPPGVWGAGTIKSEMYGRVAGVGSPAIPAWSAALNVKFSALPGSEGAFFWRRGGGSAGYFNLLTDGRVKVYGSGSTTATSTTTVSTGTSAWHQIVITCDATNTIVYVDGNSIVTLAESLGFGADQICNTLSAGTSPVAELETFRFWTSTLTPTQISTLGA